MSWRRYQIKLFGVDEDEAWGTRLLPGLGDGWGFGDGAGMSSGFGAGSGFEETQRGLCYGHAEGAGDREWFDERVLRDG